MSENCCKACEWYCEFEGVCVNGDSDHVADFINPESYCDEFEEKRK